jgi:hypothetical protein
VKNDQVCSCPICEEQEAQRLRAFAIMSGPSPGDHVEFAMPIAS